MWQILSSNLWWSVWKLNHNFSKKLMIMYPEYPIRISFHIVHGILLWTKSGNHFRNSQSLPEIFESMLVMGSCKLEMAWVWQHIFCELPLICWWCNTMLCWTWIPVTSLNHFKEAEMPIDLREIHLNSRWLRLSHTWLHWHLDLIC